MKFRYKERLRYSHCHVIRNGDLLIAKRIQTLWSDGVQLLNDKTEYPPNEIFKDKPENLDDIGKAVWVGKHV